MLIKPGAAGRAPNSCFTPEISMAALKELFSTDVGLMSVAGFAFMLGMGAFFLRYFLKHIREDSERAGLGVKR
jgi:hypothetical protein